MCGLFEIGLDEEWRPAKLIKPALSRAALSVEGDDVLDEAGQLLLVGQRPVVGGGKSRDLGLRLDAGGLGMRHDALQR